MINPSLYKKPVAIDSAKHRDLKLARPVLDWSVASSVNAMFLATAEFGDACAEYPIVFVDAGKDEKSGKQQIAPIVVFGLNDKQNLYADGGKWRAMYQPALLRSYPFGIARQDEDRVVIVMEEGFEGWSQTEGQALFDAEGKSTEFMNGMRDQLERLETEIQRTRLFGNLMVDSDLLQTMRFDATLPDGQTISVDGFLTVDENKLSALSDAKVLEFHKNGALALIHAHQISLRHMRRLVEWHVQRVTAAQAAAA